MNKFGYVLVGTAAFPVKVAAPDYNADKIIEMAAKADKEDMDILVFQELALTGYTCADLFLHSNLRKKTEAAVNKILEATKDIDTLLVVGMPLYTEGELYNCAAFIFRGKLLGLVPKIYIPNYNEFYEKRWFMSGAGVDREVSLGDYSVPLSGRIQVIMDNGARVAAEVCEDLWVNMPPSSEHTINGANIIVNPSASDAVIGKKKYRTKLVTGQSARCICGYVYASAGAGESSTDLVFDGHQIIAECGKVIKDVNKQSEGITCGLIDVEKIDNDRVRFNSALYAANKTEYRKVYVSQVREHSHFPTKVNPYPFVPADRGDRMARCEEILDIQAAGLAERLGKIGNPKAVIGISGGLDSTLALLVIVKAFRRINRPNSDIVAITMPGFGTTDRTKNNSTKLMELLGVDSREISIREAATLHMKDIGQPTDKFDITYENIQARERTQILMDVANMVGGIVVGTGDLSELCLGWCTYNADHMSMYGVNASVPKTLVRYIIESFALLYEDSDKEKEQAIKAVLLDICDTPISPELLPVDENGNMTQKTESTIGKYDLHDFFIYHLLRNGFDMEKIRELAYVAFDGIATKAEVDDTLSIFRRRFYSQQFKRSCLPDGPKVGSVCISPRGDLRMPSDVSYY